MTEFTQENIDKIVTDLSSIAIDHGLDLLGALALIVVGFIIAGWAKRGTSRALGRVHNIDATLQKFLSSAVRYIALVLVGISNLGDSAVDVTIRLWVVQADPGRSAGT